MIRLNQYDNGGALWIDPARIISITDCPPYSDQLLGFEGGRRTRIDYQGGMALVTETPDEIAVLAGWTQAPSHAPTAEAAPQGEVEESAFEAGCSMAHQSALRNSLPEGAAS